MQKSESITGLMTALVKARSKFKPVEKTSTNPFFKSKYADLSVVIDATQEALTANGLSILQLPIGLEGGDTVAVETMLAHISGEWISQIIYMTTGKHDAQAIGSAITYARRYALQAFLNVAAEDDDDGGEAVGKPFPKKEKSAIPTETDPEFDERTADQRIIGTTMARAFIEFAKSKGVPEAALVAKVKPTATNLSAVLEEITKAELEELKTWVMTQARMPTASAAMAPVASVPIQTPKGPTNSKTVSEPQLKRLFAISKGKGVAVTDVDIYIAETFGLSSKAELSQEQYKTTVAWVEAQ